MTKRDWYYYLRAGRCFTDCCKRLTWCYWNVCRGISTDRGRDRDIDKYRDRDRDRGRGRDRYRDRGRDRD